MSPKTTIPLVLAAVVAFGGVSGLAYANEKSEGHESAQELAALQSAKISLTDAIATAQKEVADGKVVDAGVENENGTISYAVEIEKNGTVQKVQIDLATGKVLKVAADTDDEENESD